MNPNTKPLTLAEEVERLLAMPPPGFGRQIRPLVPWAGSPPPARQMKVAIHEAAHAVALLEFGWIFGEVVIWDECGEGDTDGLVTYPYGAVWVTTTDRREEQLVITLAGFLAEDLYQEVVQYGGIRSAAERASDRTRLRSGRRWAKGYDPPHLFSSCLGEGDLGVGVSADGDFAKVGDLIEMLSPVRAARLDLLRIAERETEEMLRRRWKAVVRLAEALLRQPTGAMTYQQVCRLLRRKPRSDQPPGVLNTYG